ncbi:MAG TPA: TonB-dependent receptor, partial [Burkholderiaceae bacterium]|nr:TonB-dependent receptor [Burkholderiaceae bacterium]
RMGLQWQVIGARYTVAGTRMPSHALVDATLNWAPAGRPWTLAASIFNLFDRAWADPGGAEHVQDTLARDGRIVELRASRAF